MANMILGPIIGGLSHEQVNLWARADKAATLHAWLGTKSNGSDARLVGKTQLKAVNGFAGIVPVKKLKSDKKYFFALTLNPSLPPPKAAYRSFRTFPETGKAKSFRFSFGSCFLPLRSQPGLAFKHMREQQKDLSFLLMLGDQIYADDLEVNGLGRVPLNVSEYRKVYETNWGNLHHRDLLAQTPVFMMLDDHEIDNDWHWTDITLQKPDIAWISRLLRKLQGRPKEEQFLSTTRALTGLRANWEHQAIHAPAALSPNGPLAYEFEYGAAAFFVTDTRTQRVLNSNQRQLLGEKQWKKLEAWLLKVKVSHSVKFIVSSISILTDIIGDPTNDRWGGFKQERERLLKFISDHEIKGIYFLVGDLHSAHAVSADVISASSEAFPIKQFCSSPFEQKPANFTTLLDHPAQSSFLQNRKRHFSIGEINYGVVNVDFSDRKNPQVSLELNYEKDGVWKVQSG